MNINATHAEANSLKPIWGYHVCNTEPKEDLDSIIRVASYICKTPVALISFGDQDSQWIKAKLGLETYPGFLHDFICKHTVQQVSLLEIEDIQDRKLVADTSIRFFASMPLINPEGYCIGSLCVMDTIPRQLDNEQKSTLQILSRTVVSYLETTRKNRELQTLLSKAQKFQNLFNNFNEIHCITDREGKIEFISDSIEPLLGYSSKEALERNIWDFTVPGERDRVMPTIYEAIDRKENKFEIETRVITKSGKVRWFSWSDVIKEGYWLVNGRDITEAKEKELLLQTLSVAVEKSSVGILIRNGKHEVLWMNGALEDMIGYKSTELRGKTFGNSLVGEGTDLSVFEVARKALEEKRPYEVEMQLYKKDGTPVWLYLSNNPLYDHSEELERQVCIAVDITERKKAEIELIKTRDEALRLGNAKENFLSVMSHEMRTTLNAVIGITRTLKEENPMEHQMENLNILTFSSQNLLTLINDVLDFTKIETGNLQLESIPFDIKKLASNTIDSLKYRSNEKNIQLNYTIDPGIPQFVKGDPTRLYQIFINLLGNAIKFTEDGQVNLQMALVNRTNDTVSIQFIVSDTGIGIPADKRDFIFEAYTQAGPDVSRKYGGTGLGLAITKKLIELSGSHITVESEVGKGTTFYFTIDFKKTESISLTSDNEMGAVSLPSSVLLVDDNAINRLLGKKVFDRWDIQTDFAENGAEALEKIQANDYDLVFMDIHMPVMDGLEAVRRIRAIKEEKYQKLPVIALTASALNGDDNKFKEAGMNDFILKPFEPHFILKKIRPYLMKEDSR